MPKISFSTDYVVTSASDYPKLSLETSQKALVLVFDREPYMEFMHTLQMPELGPDNKPIYETSVQWGKEVTKPRMQFVGRSLCLGDFEKLTQTGADPDGCVICKQAVESDVVQRAQPRYAVHVAHYNTKPGSFEVPEPFGVQIKAWAFSGKIYDKLVDFQSEWGDLREHDLKLGPCESKQYQKFDIAVSAQAEWLRSDERKKIMAEAYKNGQSQDLTASIARRLSRDQVADDLQKVMRQNAIAFGRGGAEEEPVATADVAKGMDLDGLLSGGQSTPEQPAEAKQDEAPAVSTTKKENAGNVTSLDDLLNDL